MTVDVTKTSETSACAGCKGAPNGGAAGLQPPPNPPKLKFKKHRFCRYDNIKKFYVISPSAENQPLKSADD
jgi:hypothetical protein